ncbi:GTPase IMAP family member 7-like isoform X2 [Littorina saxatilis]|uniref:AIG1-type G domain-containing protein n=1 Tax=Littorina saxatilis TaxID=31220 RepID=A0AAN9G2R4_9CAEN
MASKVCVPETDYRFLIVGKSGSGKSATGNTIMGTDVFNTGFGLAAGTKMLEYRTSPKAKKGVTFTVVDTPGLFDPKVSNEVIVEHIVKAEACLHPGPHAVLYVLQIGRFTPEERETFMRLKELFDENIVQYTIIIFTRGDELKRKKMTLEQLLEQADEPFKDVMRECGSRVLIFNNENKGKRDKQVKELMAMVQTMLMKNNNEPYHCKVQEIVNTELERRATVRAKEKIHNDPKLRKVFDDMGTHAREARESAEKHHKEVRQSLMKTQQIEKMIQERLEAKEKEQREKEAHEKAERERKEQEEQEEREQERNQQHDEQRKEREKEPKQREQEEGKRRPEEERNGKEREAEEKKRMEELQKQLDQLKKERDVQQQLEAEKRKIQQEYEEKLEAERKKLHDEQMEKSKQDVADGKEKLWVRGVAAAVGEAWRAARDWFGF